MGRLVCYFELRLIASIWLAADEAALAFLRQMLRLVVVDD